MQGLSDEQASDAAKTVPHASLPRSSTCQSTKRPKLSNAHVHVSANSGCQEWYTPPRYSMQHGRSSEASIPTQHRALKHKRWSRLVFISDRDIDGLTQQWNGRVWLNPPYSNGMVDRFAENCLKNRIQAEFQRRSCWLTTPRRPNVSNLLQRAAACVSFVSHQVPGRRPAASEVSAARSGASVLRWSTQSFD